MRHLSAFAVGILAILVVYSVIHICINPNSVDIMIICAGLAYLIGSVPTGPVIAKIMGLGDLRTIGSGNIGATNVLRTGNKKAAAFTLIGDMLKGTLAVFLCYALPLSGFTFPVSQADFGMILGFCAFFGHLYPIFLNFQGGKGVATYLGVILAYSPLLWGLALLIWIVAGYISKISSVGALTMALFMPIFIYIYAGDMSLSVIILALISIIVILKHHTNIKKIYAGTESKISFLDKKPV